MNSIHTIRLHGPWQASVVEWFDSQRKIQSQTGMALQIKTPIPSSWGDWLGDGFQGRVAYVRKFGMPTGVTPDQKIWLRVSDVDFRAGVHLNGEHLGDMQLGDPALRIEVQKQLRKSNELRIEVETSATEDRGHRNGLAGGLIGSVCLEIEE